MFHRLTPRLSRYGGEGVEGAATVHAAADSLGAMAESASRGAPSAQLQNPGPHPRPCTERSKDSVALSLSPQIPQPSTLSAKSGKDAARSFGKTERGLDLLLLGGWSSFVESLEDLESGGQRHVEVGEAERGEGER